MIIVIIQLLLIMNIDSPRAAEVHQELQAAERESGTMQDIN